MALSAVLLGALAGRTQAELSAVQDTSLTALDSSIVAQLVTVVELMKLEARQDSLRAELNALEEVQLEYRDNWALWPAVLAVLIVAVWSSRAFRRRAASE